MPDYSSVQKGILDDALRAKLDGVTQANKWKYSTYDNYVRFSDGQRDTVVPVLELEQHFNGAILRVDRTFQSARSRNAHVVVWKHGLSAPPHEFDRSGTHVTHKSS